MGHPQRLGGEVINPHDKAFSGWRDPRAWIAGLLILLANRYESSFEAFLYPPLAHLLHAHHVSPAVLGQRSYGAEMLVRLVWNLLLWTGVCKVLGRTAGGFPLRDKAWFRSLGVGLATGLCVMLTAMLGIWATRSASVIFSGQHVFTAFSNGGLWLALDFIGALGEELLGRATILIVAARFFGWRGAVLASGLMFSVFHLHNPGANWLWLLRLFLQGVLLAFAVFRTQSLWWSVGYHTGWNWISAPLFGAAGSGYLDEGHVFDFVPHGPTWITGGSVGPEGSLFAFLAVSVAAALLVAQTRRSGTNKMI